ncbi:unnamed protein product [Sphagnum jensenii]
MSGRLEVLPVQLLETRRAGHADDDLPFRPSVLGPRSPRNANNQLATVSPSKQQTLDMARQPLLLRKHKEASNFFSGSRGKGECTNHPKRQAEFKGTYQGKQQLILEYVQLLKRQHLSLLKQEISCNLQIASSELKQNDDTLLEVKSIVHDIESQLEAIVNTIP